MATRDIATSGLTHWLAPYTGSFETVIPEGTILVAPGDAIESAEGFYCVPEQYDEMELALVPDADRRDPKYSGFAFVFLDADLGNKLRQLHFANPS